MPTPPPFLKAYESYLTLVIMVQGLRIATRQTSLERAMWEVFLLAITPLVLYAVADTLFESWNALTPSQAAWLVGVGVLLLRTLLRVPPPPRTAPPPPPSLLRLVLRWLLGR